MDWTRDEDGKRRAERDGLGFWITAAGSTVRLFIKRLDGGDGIRTGDPFLAVRHARTITEAKADAETWDFDDWRRTAITVGRRDMDGYERSAAAMRLKVERLEAMSIG